MKTCSDGMFCFHRNITPESGTKAPSSQEARSRGSPLHGHWSVSLRFYCWMRPHLHWTQRVRRSVQRPCQSEQLFIIVYFYFTITLIQGELFYIDFTDWLCIQLDCHSTHVNLQPSGYKPWDVGFWFMFKMQATSDKIFFNVNNS